MKGRKPHQHQFHPRSGRIHPQGIQNQHVSSSKSRDLHGGYSAALWRAAAGWLRNRRNRGILSLILFVNALLGLLFLLHIFGSGHGGEREVAPVVDTERAWPLDLEEPPAGNTCEEWLADADEPKQRPTSMPSSSSPSPLRDFRARPIHLRGGGRRVVEGCDVGCEMGTAEGGSNGTDPPSPWCDAAFGPSPSPPCPLNIIDPRLVSLEDLEPGQDPAALITAGPSLAADIPTGVPHWGQFSLLAPPAPKGAAEPLVAVLHNACEDTARMLSFVSSFRSHGIPTSVVGNCASPPSGDAEVAKQIGRHKFALLFEELEMEGFPSSHFWLSLSRGTIPLVVSPSAISRFSPSDNAVIQLQDLEDVPRSVSFLRFLLVNPDAYEDALRWKADWPSDSLITFLDITAVDEMCRMCMHVATRISERALTSMRRPCRCWEDRSNSTVYHLYARERGRFAYTPFFLKSSHLTVANLVREVYKAFEARGSASSSSSSSSLDSDPVWSGHRPVALSSTTSPRRVFRVYPVLATQDRALHGAASFRTDEQLRKFVEGHPCPRLEVIFL